MLRSKGPRDLEGDDQLSIELVGGSDLDLRERGDGWLAANSSIEESSIESSKATGLSLGSPGPEELSLGCVLSDERTERWFSDKSGVPRVTMSSEVVLVEGM